MAKCPVCNEVGIDEGVTSSLGIPVYYCKHCNADFIEVLTDLEDLK